MTTGRTIALTEWAFVGKVMSLLFNMLSIKVCVFTTCSFISFTLMFTLPVIDKFLLIPDDCFIDFYFVLFYMYLLFCLRDWTCPINIFSPTNQTSDDSYGDPSFPLYFLGPIGHMACCALLGTPFSIIQASPVAADLVPLLDLLPLLEHPF